MRPSLMSCKRLAKRCAPVPRPGKSRGQVLTMAISMRSFMTAGAFAAWANWLPDTTAAAVPTAAPVIKSRRFM